METELRAALIGWLAADAGISAGINAITEEAPVKAALPWLAIAASASADWSVKEREGREVRIALELHCRGDAPGTAAELTRQIESRVATFPRQHSGFAVASTVFLKSRTAQRAGNVRSILFEYRFRLLAA